MWCEVVHVQMQSLGLGLSLQVNNSAADHGHGLSLLLQGVWLLAGKYPLLSTGGFELVACV